MGLPHIPIGELWVKFPIYWVPQRVGRLLLLATSSILPTGFQFIGFPSEWGGWSTNLRSHIAPAEGFQFIGFPSEWGVETSATSFAPSPGFQFIGFPSEWGVVDARMVLSVEGEFPIYWVPQRVGRKSVLVYTTTPERVSNLLGSPASGEGKGRSQVQRPPDLFPIYWVPQRVGSSRSYLLLRRGG